MAEKCLIGSQLCMSCDKNRHHDELSDLLVRLTYRMSCLKISTLLPWSRVGSGGLLALRYPRRSYEQPDSIRIEPLTIS